MKKEVLSTLGGGGGVVVVCLGQKEKVDLFLSFHLYPMREVPCLLKPAPYRTTPTFLILCFKDAITTLTQ